MKIREITSNDLDKYYLDHDPEQYLKGFNRCSDILLICNANASGAVTCKSYNSKNT